MSVAKVTEISASSPNSFDDAVKVGIARAAQTLKGIKSAWVNEMNVDIQDGQVTAYRVNMKITFILND